MAKVINEIPTADWIDNTQTLGDNKWLVGKGVLPCDVMIIGHYPAPDDAAGNGHFTGHMGHELISRAMSCGVDLSHTYMTNLVKFCPVGKKPKATEIRASLPMLHEEIRRGQPRLIICMGGEVLKAVMGSGFKITTHRGTFMQLPDSPSIQVMATYALSYSQYNPAADAESVSDWNTVANWQRGITTRQDVTDYRVVCTIEDAARCVTNLMEQADIQKDGLVLAIDCEWHGKHWMDPNGWLRTVQVAYAPDRVLVFNIVDETPRQLCDADAMYRIIKQLLEHPKVKIVGHNAIADGEWLRTYGVDIRNNMFFDTIIAEHTLNSAATFGLDTLTEKYTQMGNYSLPLNEWKVANPTMVTHGYGYIPSDILIPYAAMDAAATYRVYLRQYPLLQEAGYLKPRGEYASLFQASLDVQKALYEIQFNGMLFDEERYNLIRDAYHTKLNELENQIVHLAASAGLPEFNFRSPMQVSTLLFEILKLTPVKTTAAHGNKPWDQIRDDAKLTDVSASTDKRTLDILQDQHPVAGILRDLRKIDHACKTWLPVNYDPATHDEVSSGGGLIAKVWPDGRVHAVFSQLKETARFSSRNPNMQNFPKRAEGDVRRIFGVDKKPPDIRTIFIPRHNYVFMEADWKQAELFVLAGMAGDQTMLGALRTPGKDLHDLTAITAFGLRVLDPDGNEVPDQYLLDLAMHDLKTYGTVEGHEFEEYQKGLRYLDQRGVILSRSVFKETIRISAKNLNFGIPYGRGSLDIAVQVKAETGTDDSIEDLKEQIDTMMEAWKTITYPDAWSYMCQCADNVDTQGYVENPWGRRRIFPATTDRMRLAAYKREAQNFPIQSTVADTCIIALRMMQTYREERNLHYKIINQMHDAIQLEVPCNEIEEARQACQTTMGGIYVPIPNAPLNLAIDIDITSRWGEKIKQG